MFTYPSDGRPTQYAGFGAGPAAASAGFLPETVACMQKEMAAAKAAGRKANTAVCMAQQQTTVASRAAAAAPTSWGTLIGVTLGVAAVGAGAWWYFKGRKKA